MRTQTKSFCFFALLLFSITSGRIAHADDLRCRYGFSWQISQSPIWGLGKPIITRVQPYSPSADAGLKIGDIIEVVDGYATSHLSAKEIQALLQSRRDLHTLQTSNFGLARQKHILGYECHACASINERELAELFSLYSIEDANEHHIKYPYSFFFGNNTSLRQANYYSITEGNTQTALIDESINKELNLILSQKGLKLRKDADLIFSSYYELRPLGGEENRNETLSWRYDRSTNGLKPFPLYDYQSPEIKDAKYKLTFGLLLQNKQSKKIIWSCEANEYLSEAISIDEYAQSAIETMLLGFPYITETNAPTLKIRTLHYNYTGIIYSSKVLNTIVDIEDKSPAMRSGLRPGDVIKAINGQKITTPNSEDLLNHYFKTAQSMERYRDNNIPPLRPTIGDIPLSYWQVKDYSNISNFIKQRNNSLAFTYLFGFRPYINHKNANVLFEIERDGQIYFVPVTPEYRDESTINF